LKNSKKLYLNTYSNLLDDFLYHVFFEVKLKKIAIYKSIQSTTKTTLALLDLVIKACGGATEQPAGEETNALVLPEV
jgi:hypothetical protein